MSTFRTFNVNQIMIELTENDWRRIGLNYFCATVMNVGGYVKKCNFF
jgi:hypothetical protein